MTKSLKFVICSWAKQLKTIESVPKQVTWKTVGFFWPNIIETFSPLKTRIPSGGGTLIEINGFNVTGVPPPDPGMYTTVHRTVSVPGYGRSRLMVAPTPVSSCHSVVQPPTVHLYSHFGALGPQPIYPPLSSNCAPLPKMIFGVLHTTDG